MWLNCLLYSRPTYHKLKEFFYMIILPQIHFHLLISHEFISLLFNWQQPYTARHKCRNKRNWISISFWKLSFSVSAEFSLLFLSGRLQCWIDFSEQWQWQLYMTLVAVTLFVVPAVIISACYTIIVSTIWSTSKQLTPDPNRRQSRSEWPQLSDTITLLLGSKLSPTAEMSL